MKENMGIRKTVVMCLFVFALLLASPRNGFCSFENNWGMSDGDHQIARWLVGNGYSSDYNDALGIARNNYIGHNSGDADGFLWNMSQPVTFQIMAEESAHADYSTLGFYTGSGDSKSLTQIFGGLENGPKTLSINGSFGLYLGIWDNMKWYTDRSENHEQLGMSKNLGGDPQALIYELKPGQEWLVAWEDLDTTQSWSDKDFNDMYVKVSTGTPSAPEPVSSTLFLLGSGAMAISRLRNKILI